MNLAAVLAYTAYDIATTPLAPIATNCAATDAKGSPAASSADWQALSTNSGTRAVASAWPSA